MDIVTVWITRTYSQDTPEMVCAWDEYCCEGNWEGFEKERDEAIAAIGDDLDQVRTINIRIDYGDIQDAFAEKTVKASKVVVDDA